MHLNTGPPDWDGFLEGVGVVLLAFMLLVPYAHVVDSLSYVNPNSVHVFYQH